MKIQIAKCFDTTNLTDQEIVFCYVLTRIMKKHGFEEFYTFDGFDWKILTKGDPMACITTNAYTQDFKDHFTIAYYSERRVGVKLSKKAKTKGIRQNGNLLIGYQEVQIHDARAIIIFSYLLGMLGSMENYLYESESVIGFRDEDLDMTLSNSEAMRQTRLTDPFELNQLLSEVLG